MTEDKPHIVYPTVPESLPMQCFMASDYRAAHAIWLLKHTVDKPWLIAALGRTIDPAAHIVDVNE